MRQIPRHLFFILLLLLTPPFATAAFALPRNITLGVVWSTKTEVAMMCLDWGEWSVTMTCRKKSTASIDCPPSACQPGTASKSRGGIPVTHFKQRGGK
jgi:hypothetical protein